MDVVGLDDVGLPAFVILLGAGEVSVREYCSANRIYLRLFLSV